MLYYIYTRDIAQAQRSINLQGISMIVGESVETEFVKFMIFGQTRLFL